MRFLTAAAALTVVGLGSPTFAQDTDPLEAEAVRIYKSLPRHSVILQLPDPEVWTSYGTSGDKAVKAEGVPGKSARRFSIAKVGANPWDAAVQAANAVPTQAGDIVHASFWIRASKLPRGQSAVTLPLALQKNGEPYTQIAYSVVEIGRDWQLVSVSGETVEDYGPEGFVITVQAAGAKQTLDVGPVFINTLGPGPVPAPKASAENTASSPSTVSERMDLTALPDGLRVDLRKLVNRLPSGAELLSDPQVRDSLAYGGPSRLVDDAGVPGGRALEVENEKAQIESWQTGINVALTERIERGDVLLLAVWAKAIEARNEAQTATLQPMRIQQSREPYTHAAEGAAYLSRDWKLHYMPAEASNAVDPGPAGLTYHLGLTPQTVRVGPSYLLRFPAGTDVRSLPKNEIDYAGRAEGAAWRSEAMARIDRTRRADLTIAAPPGATVRVEQIDHAFNFGTFVGHDFKAEGTEDERRTYEAVRDNFNTLTLPIYWQDWGWAKQPSMKGQYQRMIADIADTPWRWRAHPVIWPGENYMPSRIKDAPDTAKRRAMVMDHVREVVTALRDAERPPFAVDMVNEVRANRFFQDNGDPTVVEDAFMLANEIAPELPLFVNDYAILNNGGLNAAAIGYYHEWLETMLGKGVPVGGIGFQGHFSAGLTPPERLIEILEDFGRYDLPLHITEFDIETLDDAAQADYTRDAILAALSVPQVDAFVFWGFWAGDHWKPNAAMLREDWTEKPAYTAWRDLVFGELWTDVSETAGADGRVVLRPMQGRLRVSVNGQSREIVVGPEGTTVRF